MAHDRQGWRKIGNALAALVLALLVFGPSLDGFICSDDFGPAAAAAAAAENPAADTVSDRQPPPVDRDGCAASTHCHCHHGPSHLAIAPEAAALPDPNGAAGPPARERPPVLDRQFQLIRPPRA